MQEMYIIGLKQALLEAYNGLPGKPDLTKICCENIPIAKSWYNPVVPPKKNRIDPWEYDRILYKRRNEVERFFRRIKHFRRVFTRYDKLDIVFAGFILFAMIFDFLVGTDSKSSRRKGYCYYENPSDQNLLSLFSSYSTAAYSPFACRNFGSCFHLCSTASASA